MKTFLLFLLLISTAGFAQQKDSLAKRSVYIINGRVVDSAAMTGVKFRKMDVLTGQRAEAAGILPGKRVILLQLENEQYNLFGIVTNSRGKPLGKAAIKPDGNQQAVETDACGHFYLRGIRAGTRITVSRKGYRNGALDVYKRPDELMTVELQKK